MHRLKSTIALALLAAAPGLHAAATFTAPTPYLSAADNPFAGPFAYSHLETFEDGLFNTPGITASGGVINFGQPAVDSVDADDGAIDGLGNRGASWYLPVTSVTLSFDAGALGSLPTNVGVVFTDIFRRLVGDATGVGDALIEVFDALGNPQGSATFPMGDGSALGETDEDRFIGARYEPGIGSVRLSFSGQSDDWEIDHVFYAVAAPQGVPVPASAWLSALALATLLLRRSRR